MKDKEIRIERICETIKSRIGDINKFYRQGPDLYFYKKVFAQRQGCSIHQFLNLDYNIEILYATLVSWDMNSRGAKMQYFDDFKNCLLLNLSYFEKIESFENIGKINYHKLRAILGEIYDNLTFMKTGGSLVSNSKVLHFLFPSLLLPMDRNNTLNYFYNNTGESKQKYLAIMDICFEIMQKDENWGNYLDNKWNTTVPKMIDNAILLLVGKSLKNNTA